MKKPKLVLVEWVDSHYSHGWKNVEEFKDLAKNIHCESVGWLLQENKRVVVIVPHLTRDDDELLQGTGEMIIPRCAVTKMTVLKS